MRTQAHAHVCAHTPTHTPEAFNTQAQGTQAQAHTQNK